MQEKELQELLNNFNQFKRNYSELCQQLKQQEIANNQLRSHNLQLNNQLLNALRRGQEVEGTCTYLTNEVFKLSSRLKQYQKLIGQAHEQFELQEIELKGMEECLQSARLQHQQVQIGLLQQTQRLKDRLCKRQLDIQQIIANIQRSSQRCLSLTAIFHQTVKPNKSKASPEVTVLKDALQRVKEQHLDQVKELKAQNLRLRQTNQNLIIQNQTGKSIKLSLQQQRIRTNKIKEGQQILIKELQRLKEQSLQLTVFKTEHKNCLQEKIYLQSQLHKFTQIRDQYHKIKDQNAQLKQLISDQNRAKDNYGREVMRMKSQLLRKKQECEDLKGECEELRRKGRSLQVMCSKLQQNYVRLCESNLFQYDESLTQLY